MRFTADIRELAATAAAVVQKKSLLDFARAAHLSAKDGKVKVLASDYATTVLCEVEADVEDPGAASVDANDLRDISKVVGLAEYQIDGTRLRVKSGRTKANLPLMTVDDTTEAEKTLDADLDEVDAVPFLDMMSRAMVSAGTDDTRANLCGVHVLTENGLLTMAATDGHRLAVLKRSTNLSIKGSLTIGRAALAALKRIIDGHDKVSIGFSGAFFVAATPGRVMSSRLIDMPYPDIHQVIPDAKARTVTALVARKDLVDALRTVTSIARADNPARFQIASDGVRVTVADPESGEVETQVGSLAVQGTASFAANAAYVSDALSQLDSTQITIEVVDALSPITLTATDEAQCFVMPMRV